MSATARTTTTGSEPRVPVTQLALAGLLAAVLAVASWVSIPFVPVPLTLQTLAVLVAGGLLGRYWGPVSVGVYILVGLAGVPVFAGGHAGPAVIAGPLGGFLLGFVFAAFIMGVAGDVTRRRGVTNRRGLTTLILGAAAAGLAVYVVGVPWFMAVTGMTLRGAMPVAFFPFIPGDILKAAVAVVVIRAVDRA
ncbi:MAG: biotin transporter BioY, partial [Thermoleophilia bacterium]|nr:biotin transporter BioY [Thermoleophilia bacterium]